MMVSVRRANEYLRAQRIMEIGKPGRTNSLSQRASTKAAQARMILLILTIVVFFIFNTGK